MTNNPAVPRTIKSGSIACRVFAVVPDEDLSVVLWYKTAAAWGYFPSPIVIISEFALLAIWIPLTPCQRLPRIKAANKRDAKT